MSNDIHESDDIVAMLQSSTHVNADYYESDQFCMREGLKRAKIWCFEQQFRSLIRAVPNEFLHDPKIRAIFESQQKRLERLDFSYYYVTVGLPIDSIPHHDLPSIQALLNNTKDSLRKKIDKALRKKWIDKYYVSFELGDSEHHPHINFLVQKKVAYKCKSEVIREFASTFSVEQNFVHVDEVPDSRLKKLIQYIQKEKIWYKDYLL